jgi:hypothetical protein
MPSGGLFKRLGFQSNPPFTTLNCDNVRLDDTQLSRERIGSRPGVVSLGTVGSAGEMRLVSGLRYKDGSLWVDLSIAVRGALLYYSTDAATWTAASGTLSGAQGQISAAEVGQKLYIADGGNDIKVFDPVTTSVQTMVSTGGTPPTNCSIAERYRDRLVLAGDADDPNQWYMSKLGDPNNWDYTDTAIDSAVSSQNSNAGEVGEPILSVMPHGDDCIIFGCLSSIWTLRSDPNFGGFIDNLSQRVGVVGKEAWTRTSENWLYFLTQDGIMTMPPGCGDIPRSMSRERIPKELLFIPADFTFSLNSFNVSMDYDVNHRGIHLFVSSSTGSALAQHHYWLDVNQTMTGDAANVATFWPVSLASDGTLDPMSAWTYERLDNSNRSSVLMASRDGDIRVFDVTVTCDEDSFIEIGPLPTSGQAGVYMDGSIDSLNIVLDKSSNPVSLKVESGEAAEDSVLNVRSTEVSKTIDQSRSRTNLRYRGGSYHMKISSIDKLAWVLEAITSVINPRGKIRFR